MTTTKIKTRKTLPDVYYSDGILSTLQNNINANVLAVRVLGLIAMNGTNNNTGFSDDKKTVFAHYNKIANTLIVRLFGELD